MHIVRITLFSCFLCVAYVFNVQCQWERTMEYYGNVLSFHSFSHSLSVTYILAGTNGGGIFRSTDFGTNWNLMGMTDTSVLCFASNSAGANIFAGTFGQGVKRSDSEGEHWTTYNNGLTTTADKTVRALVTIPDGAGGTNVFAGTDGGVFLSTSLGGSWTNKDLSYVTALAIDYGINGTRFYATAYGNGVYESSDNGTNWIDISNNLACRDLTLLARIDNGSVDTTLFTASLGHYLFRSTNNGANWTTIDDNNGLTSGWVNALAICPDAPENIFAGTSGGVFLSTDNGTSWTVQNEGLTNTDVKSLIITDDGAGGNYLFAGTINGGIWRRSLDDIITSVNALPGVIPKAFKLEQNYPNPFNPSTTFKFSLPNAGFVKLAIYDVLGHEVKTIISENLNKGTYTKTWNAHTLAAGVYFYRLQLSSTVLAGSFTATKKLLLLK